MRHEMRYLSVCSGIEAVSVAWGGLGLTPVAFSEIEAFPSAVLQHRYPAVPNIGDMSKVLDLSLRFDILVGGTPCQSFSLAGKRGGLEDERGGLAITFCRIAQSKQPKFIVWENVPGVLSCDKGRVFARICQELVLGGYSLAWRVLDAKHFGVPQRRRRLFLVGCLGRRPPAEILFESGSRQRGIAAVPEERCETTTSLGCGFGAGCHKALFLNDDSHHGSSEEVAAVLRAKHNNQQMVLPGSWWDGGQTAQTLDAVLHKGQTMPEKNRFPAVLHHRIRRITPLEAERLMGLPDNWTRIPWRGKREEECPDTLRYKAIGNSMAVPVMHWIGERVLTYNILGGK